MREGLHVVSGTMRFQSWDGLGCRIRDEVVM